MSPATPSPFGPPPQWVYLVGLGAILLTTLWCVLVYVMLVR